MLKPEGWFATELKFESFKRVHSKKCHYWKTEQLTVCCHFHCMSTIQIKKKNKKQPDSLSSVPYIISTIQIKRYTINSGNDYWPQIN